MNLSASAIPVSVVAAVTILGWRWMDLAVKRPPPQVRVDTVYAITHDTVVSRARDTMRVVVREVGPLTEQIVVRAVCGKFAYGDDTQDHFGYNVYGMVFCPKEDK